MMVAVLMRSSGDGEIEGGNVIPEIDQLAGSTCQHHCKKAKKRITSNMNNEREGLAVLPIRRGVPCKVDIGCWNLKYSLKYGV